MREENANLQDKVDDFETRVNDLQTTIDELEERNEGLTARNRQLQWTVKKQEEARQFSSGEAQSAFEDEKESDIVPGPVDRASSIVKASSNLDEETLMKISNARRSEPSQIKITIKKG